MTIAVETAKVLYVGTGSSGPFTVPFKFYENADVEVILGTINSESPLSITETVLTLDVDYTVLGAGEADGGSVTLVEDLETNQKLLIRRADRLLQEQSWVDLSEFTAEAINDALDKLSAQIQRVHEIASRALQASAMSGVCNATLQPVPNYLIGWDSLGEGWQNLPRTELSIPEIDHIGNYDDSLAGAVGIIGSTRKLLLVNKGIEEGTLTVPVTTALWIPPEGKITVDGTIRLLGQLLAGRYQIFSISETA